MLDPTTDPQADMTPEAQALTSPRMSSPGTLEPARPCLDVEFVNMGMRLKGTGMRVLAGVTGRLRQSHLTAIMGPSGAGQQLTLYYYRTQPKALAQHWQTWHSAAWRLAR